MKAPDFTLPDQSGHMRNLSDYSGKWLVLYFYPKDDTPGCTLEACGLRDARSDLHEEGVEVLAISRDSQEAHKKFHGKYSLNFPLLSDVDAGVIKAYGAWGEKKFLGKTYEGILRKTFIINPKGEIVKEYSKVTPLGHAEEIKKDVAELIG